MELKDDITINAPKSVVYAALNDREVLRQCIPGCEELIKHSDTDLEARLFSRLGQSKQNSAVRWCWTPLVRPMRFRSLGRATVVRQATPKVARM